MYKLGRGVKSTIIGYVNKLACNYNHLQHNIVLNLV